jgi:hypothetical protein
MKRKTVKRGTTVFLTPIQRRALARLQVQRGDSMGHLIRQGINMLLAKAERSHK